MRPKKSENLIIEELALLAPLSMPSIAKRVGLKNSTVYEAIKDREEGLEVRGIVQAIEERKWRTGLKTANYILTIDGVIRYFSELFESRMERKRSAKSMDSNVVEVVRTYSALWKDYPLFSEAPSWEKWLGRKRYYDSLMLAAWHTARRDTPFYYRPDLEPRKRESREGFTDAVLSLFGFGVSPKFNRRVQSEIFWEPELFLSWRYALRFLHWASAGFEPPRPPDDPKILPFIQSTFEIEEKFLNAQMEDLAELKQEWRLSEKSDGSKGH